MTFRDGLIKARSHIVFLLGLFTALGIILIAGQLDQGGGARPPDHTNLIIQDKLRLQLAQAGPLRADQILWGRIAWRYFQKNIVPETGLANAADKYPSTTMWDTGSFLIGLVAAERIGLINRGEFDARMTMALDSLARLPLFDGVLPNKAYNTRTLAMSDYNNKPSSRGMGWSALDIARLMVPLMVVEERYPNHADEVRHIVRHWKLTKLVQNGILVGATVAADGTTVLHEEGRVGYEEYAAKAMIRAGVDAYQSWHTDDYVRLARVDGVQIPFDSRSADSFGAIVVTTSEPYILDGLEFGFDTRSRVFAEQVYRAQEARFDRTGILTAVSEGHLDQAPLFAYDSVYGNGHPWAVLSDTGRRLDTLRIVNAKSAFGWNALFNTPYSATLVGAVVGLNNPQGGWLEGRYEATGKPDHAETANTNGVILSSLSYRVFGPMLAPDHE